MKKIFFACLLMLSCFTLSHATPPSLNPEEKQVAIHIKEMTCQLCVYLVNTELRAIDGVIYTKANFKTRVVNVVAKPSVENQQLIEAIHKLKYTPEIVLSPP